MKTGTAKSFRVFIRTWWRNNPTYPDGLEPCAGKRRTIATSCTEKEARLICKNWNNLHKPGRLSRKAEYTSN